MPFGRQILTSTSTVGSTRPSTDSATFSATVPHGHGSSRHCPRADTGFSRLWPTFHLAIETDAECAAAWAGLAEAHVMTGILGMQSPQRAFPAAKAAAEKALMLDDGAVEAHTALADVYKLYEWDWDCAERAYEPRYQRLLATLRLPSGPPESQTAVRRFSNQHG